MKSIKIKMSNQLLGFISAVCLFSMSFTGFSQPSGGPYGCSDKTYDIPQKAKTVYYVSPNGSIQSQGSSPESPTTLEKAIKQVKSGDAIIFRGGEYRTGNLVFNQHVIMQPYQDEKPILKGTYVTTGWEKVSDTLWSVSWPHLFPAEPEGWWHKDREEKYTPLHRFNGDMVFVDGRFLQSAGSTEELDSNTFYIDYDNETVYLGMDPANHTIEITAFDRAIHRVMGDLNGVASDKKGPEIYGLEITQYADTAVFIEGTNPQRVSAEHEHGKEVVGTRIENCKITYASRIAAYLLGDSLVMKNCEISHTSTEGLYVVSSNDVLLEKNIFALNNIENITGFYPSGVKIFNQCYRVTCRGNLVTDQPNSNGIWYDVGNIDGLFVNNYVEKVGKSYINPNDRWRWRSGFFFEISKNAICIGNVFKDCDNGIFVLNSSHVEMYQNTIINSGVTIRRDERSAQGDHFGWHPESGPDIHERIGHVFINNVLVGTTNVRRPLMNIWQSDSLCNGTRSYQLKQMDHNLFIHQLNPDTNAMLVWRPLKTEECGASLFSPAELHKIILDFSANSKYFIEYEKPVFVNFENGDFRLTKDLKKLNMGMSINSNLKKIMNKPDEVKNFVGAYSY